MDVFIDHTECTPNELGTALEEACIPEMKLKMITNRGVKVFPNGHAATFCTDHWRCRFVALQADTSGSEPSLKRVSPEMVIHQNRVRHHQDRKPVRL